MNQMKTRVVILACSRIGTMFTRKILCDCGLDFGHEKILQDGGIGWKIGITVPVPQGCMVLHQVRNPIDSIPTLMTHSNRMKLTLDHELNLCAKNPIEFAMKYWYTWNKICSEKAEWTYRIEDIKNGSDVFNKFKKYVGITKDIKMPANNFNTRRHRIKNKMIINLQLLSDVNKELADKVVSLAKEFGYVRSLCPLFGEGEIK